MSKMKININSSQIPTQLKDYFTQSNSIKEYITYELLAEIEELYAYYKSLYLFDESEFSALAIQTIPRSKDLTSYYYYLKKVLDKSLKVESKRTDLSESDELNFLKIDRFVLEKVFKESAANFMSTIDKVYKKDKNVDLEETYINIGKLQLITELVRDEYYDALLEGGYKVVVKYKLNVEDGNL